MTEKYEKVTRAQMKMHEGILNILHALIYTYDAPPAYIEMINESIASIRVYLLTDCNEELLPSKTLDAMSQYDVNTPKGAIVALLKAVGW